MRSISRRAALLLVCAVACLSFGCIGVQSNPARSFESFPPPQVGGVDAYAINVNVNTRVSGTTATTSVRANLANDVLNAYTTHLAKTGRTQASGPNPYSVQVDVVDEGGGGGSMVAAVITGFTLYVIPSWMTHDYTTTLALKDASGNQFATKTYTHTLTYIQQLFLVFGMPFSGIDSEYRAMWDEVMADAAVWTVEAIDNR